MNLSGETKLDTVRFGQLVLSTGVHMHYAQYGAHEGEPIVFLHGLSDSWFSFRPVLDYLSSDYHVYMPDQRGHGNSSKPKIGYAIADFARDVIAFLDALNLRQVTLIGHSMGSVVAQRVALMAPKRVSRLVLIGSTTEPYTDELDEFRALVETLEDPVPEAFAREFQVSTLFGEVGEYFLNTVVAESLKLPAHVWKSALGELLSHRTHVEGIEAPTLIFWGDQDRIWSLKEQDALVSRIADAELRVYPQTGHALHWERPAQFVADLENFIVRTGRG